MELNRIPVIPGENPLNYEDLLARFTATLAPCDIVEETWVRDIVDLAWEVMRLRRLKTSLLNGRAGGGMHDALRTIGAGEELAAGQRVAGARCPGDPARRGGAGRSRLVPRYRHGSHPVAPT